MVAPVCAYLRDFPRLPCVALEYIRALLVIRPMNVDPQTHGFHLDQVQSGMPSDSILAADVVIDKFVGTNTVDEGFAARCVAVADKRLDTLKFAPFE